MTCPSSAVMLLILYLSGQGLGFPLQGPYLPYTISSMKKFEQTALNPGAIDNTTISGSYLNNLESNLILDCHYDETSGNGADLSGRYFSAVGNAKGYYEVKGRATNCYPGATFAFSVSWKNKANGDSESSTGWSGMSLPGTPPSLSTFWILTESTDPDNLWSAVNIGSDSFIKVSNHV